MTNTSPGSITAEPMWASASTLPPCRSMRLMPSAPGALGINRVERADGSIEALGHIGSVELQPGDQFVIETPGGGGWGEDEG